MTQIIARNSWEAMVQSFKAVYHLPEKDDPKLFKETSATIELSEDYYYNPEDAKFDLKNGLVLTYKYEKIIEGGDEQQKLEEDYYNTEFLYSGEISRVIKFLKVNPHSKCCIINLWRKKEHDQMKSFCPCIIYIYFKVQGDKLEMHSRMRANDAYKVLLMDLHALTSIHDFIACSLRLRRGKYIHSVDSLHLYRRNANSFEKFNQIIRTPLYQLVAQNLQPTLQQSDIDTFEWFTNAAKPIYRNINDLYSDFNPLKVDKIKNVLPFETFFLRKESKNGIHGSTHLIRVTILALIIHQVGDYKHVDQNELAISAAIHDTQRINDNMDVGHGNRAALWFNANFNLFKTITNLNNVEGVMYSVANHDVPIENIQITSNKSHADLLRILRTADALDRFRLPKEKWWPDTTFLMCKEGEKLIEIAKYFVYLSEKNTLVENMNFEDAVLEAAREMNLLI